MNGKELRLKRLTRNGRMLCVPLDHGITISDIGHLEEFKDIVSTIVDAGASAIVVHKGMVRFLPELKGTGLIVHLSASTSEIIPVHKVLVCDVEEALSLGADAVSVHVNLGNKYEKQMLQDLSKVSKDCEKFGVPLFAMMYIRDDENNDISNPTAEKHSVRIAAELGADIVKVGANWDPNQLKNVADSALVPIVVAGGELLDLKTFIESTKKIIKTGVLGVSFGRNVFMSETPLNTMKQLAQVVYNS